MKNEELKELLEDDDLEIIDLRDDEQEQSDDKKKIRNIIYDLAIVLGVGMLIFGGISLYKEFASGKEAVNEYDNLNDLVVSRPVVDNTTQDGESQTDDFLGEWYERIYVDMNELKKINEDIVGWIHFENEDISYPILYSLDSTKYDRMLYNGTPSRSGSIILDSLNNPDFSDERNIIYGHNRADMSMFGKLAWYKRNNYYDEHQYFQIIYGNKTYRYQIFSYFDVMPTEVDTINTFFDEINTYESCIQMLKDRSKRDHGVEVTPDDKIVTLVTCSYYGSQRFLVSAVLVDEHELISSDGSSETIEPDLEGPVVDTPIIETLESESTEDSEEGNSQATVPESGAQNPQPQPQPTPSTPSTTPEQPENGDSEAGEGGTTEGGSEENGTTEGGNGESGSEEGGTTEGGSGESGSEEGGTTEGGSGESGSEEGGTTEGGSGESGSGEGETTEGGAGESGSGESGTTEEGTGDGGNGEGESGGAENTTNESSQTIE